MTDWTFDNLDFDTHVREQLPWYDLATETVAFIARQYLPTCDGVMYDIGASTGNITYAMRDVLHERAVLAISIEPNETFVKDFKGIGLIEKSNAQDYSYQNFDVAILFLTLMFECNWLAKLYLSSTPHNGRKCGYPSPKKSI
jgi:tRNA (cmo5U34)-methyltransferase